ncbi:MAG: hypothetical protein KatS3mg015_2046 [Fimbriimonadales bacterium]|nr:MAG: hypothetical protein KatS3mg015_2046 [Fimbriimonadales bacterium]
MSVAPLNSQTLSILVRRCPRLVGLQQANAELLSLTKDVDASVAKIEKGILKNPELTAKVLRTAGSAAFGGRQVRTVSQAIMLLGLPTVRSLILSVLLDHSVKQGSHAPSFDTGRYIKRALAAGLLSRAFAKRFGGVDPEEAYVMGLLQDIGYVVLDNVAAPVFEQVLQRFRESGSATVEIERSVCATDHAAVGDVLAKEWNFVEHIQKGIAHHHAPMEAQPEYAAVAAISHAASWAADQLGLTIVEGIEQEHLNELAVAQIGVSAEDALHLAENLLAEVEYLNAA